MALPRRLPRRARRLWDYWRAEQRTFRQGLVALLLSTAAAFVAGLTLGSITGTLEALPGLLVLIPALVGMRGTIFGAIGARLGTGIHIGLFETTLRPGSILRREVEVGIISTFLSSFFLAGVAKLGAAAFGEETISIWELVTISVVGGTVASVVILLVTVGIAVLSYRRGWDLDAVSTPMVTAIGDMVTLPALFLASVLARAGGANAITAGVCTALSAGALIFALFRSSRDVRRVLLEMIPVIALMPLLDVLAGALLEANRTGLSALPGLLILVPPFISQAGALGGILSSRLSSKLQLGVITPRGRPEPPALVDSSIVALFGIVIFAVIGVVGWALSAVIGFDHPGAATMIGGTLLAGLLTLPLTILIAYYLAVLTTRFGLDPDNFGVPAITSALDLAGVACFLVAMSVSGVPI
jgi:mgtE-like transporter